MELSSDIRDLCAFAGVEAASYYSFAPAPPQWRTEPPRAKTVQQLSPPAPSVDAVESLPEVKRPEASGSRVRPLGGISQENLTRAISGGVAKSPANAPHVRRLQGIAFCS